VETPLFCSATSASHDRNAMLLTTDSDQCREILRRLTTTELRKPSRMNAARALVSTPITSA
jgi:hypothetical protein